MYSITYYHEGQMAYVDGKMYQTADNASVRALLHLAHHSDTIDGAAIIYQGKKVTKRVRTLKLWNHEPKHV